MELVYKTERPLFVLSMVIGTIVWLALVVGTFGVALVYVLLFLINYLFAHPASSPICAAILWN